MDKTCRKVLIAIDGSEHSDRAFSWYLDNLNRKDDVVCLVHVEDVPQMPLGTYPYGYEVYEEWERSLKMSAAEAKLLVSKYRDHCDSRNIVYKQFIEVGKPHNMIMKILAEERCSCVVVGSRGMGVLRRTLLGTVSGYIVHHAHVPIFVIPPAQ